MSRVVRQDYIARIRYQNSLPPPQCPPKLVDIPVPLSTFTSAGFLSGLVQQQPLNVDIDAELGMPLDMSNVPGVFDKGDESGLYPERNPGPLHPTDKLLLRDLSSLGSVAKSQPGVSFLRRTEYISTDAVKQARSSKAAESAAAILEAGRDTIDDDPRRQVEAIEATFVNAAQDVTNLKHPTRNGVTAVESYEFVPDIEMFDFTQLLIKMSGGASSAPKDETSDARYDVAVVRPMGTDKHTFMSMFLADKESAERYKHKLSLSKTEDEMERNEERLRNGSPIEEDGSEPAEPEPYGETYRFEHTRDYEISTLEADELSVMIDEKTGKAYYNPIGARLVLKRRRQLQDDKNKRPDANVTNDVSAIEITFRQLSGEEKAERDSLRRLEYGYQPE